jgi:hypothetical protein
MRPANMFFRVAEAVRRESVRCVKIRNPIDVNCSPFGVKGVIWTYFLGLSGSPETRKDLLV